MTLFIYYLIYDRLKTNATDIKTNNGFLSYLDEFGSKSTDNRPPPAFATKLRDILKRKMLSGLACMSLAGPKVQYPLTVGVYPFFP